MLVATNRHKAMEQKSDSLEEFRDHMVAEHGVAEAEQIISRLQVVDHPARYKDMERPMPDSTFICNGKVSVLQGSQGRNNGTPNYYVDMDGVRHLFGRCAVLRANTGIKFCG